MTISDQALFEQAKMARERAYAPYSQYRVGAAIVDEAGRVHIGCNVENAAYPLGACAEATAIGSMVSQGGQEIVRIAIAGGRGGVEPCTPCGGCRQAIAEFAADRTKVLLMDAQDGIRAFTVAEILPMAFRLNVRKPAR